MKIKLSLSMVVLLALAGCRDEGGTLEEGTSGEGTTTSSGVTSLPMTSGPGTTTGKDETTSGGSSTGAATGSTTVATEAGSSGTDGDTDTDATGTTGEAALPDIDMSLVQTLMEGSAYTELVQITPNSCALDEACVGGTGERRLLRFSTITPNVGGADFVAGNPDDVPENFEWGQCHGHWHFKDFASYRLLDPEGNEVATGHKMAFALIDYSPWYEDPGPEQYPLGDGTQGISVGWADVYSAGLDCQWVDVTGVPNGDYVLEVSINPSGSVEEMTLDNNIVNLAVTIDDSNGPPPPPEEWTCDPLYYNTFDGCDCGCGAFDPDCQNPTVDACEYCDNPGSCAQSCADISPNNNAVCI